MLSKDMIRYNMLSNLKDMRRYRHVVKLKRYDEM